MAATRPPDKPAELNGSEKLLKLQHIGSRDIYEVFVGRDSN